MHPLGEKNKYVGMLFLKMSKEYWALGRDGIHEISVKHAKDLARYAPMLTHVVATGMDARYDQVTMIESDTMEGIHDATAAFKIGAKGAVHRHRRRGRGHQGAAARPGPPPGLSRRAR